MENMLGVMLDCSRNAVMKVETVKAYADMLAQMGYNTMMLYTEDTYEVNNQPYFGHMRGRYSKAELKELDDYCYHKGITLIPCIQTLAHLNCMFKWDAVYDGIRDVTDILLAGESETYKLLEDIFATLAECFRTRRIHIGMDEAYMVGMGKYLQKHGFQDRFDVINAHLHRVCQIADRYGFRPMLWSDMFCKLALDSDDYYQGASDFSAITQRANLPENVELVYWDYYSEDYDRYVNMIRTNQQFGKPVIFAGGAWSWKGMAPDNGFSMAATKAALRACRDCGVTQILMTVWGDDGGECSPYAVAPALLYAAEACSGEPDPDRLKTRFREIMGVAYEDWMLLDQMLMPNSGRHINDPSKYLIYNDVFSGLLDHRCALEDDAYYAALGDQLRAIGETGAYGYLFDKYIALCDLLAVKASLGLRTRMAYQSGDRKTLEELVQIRYPLTIGKMEAFYRAFRAEWFRENKPHGFDVHDVRLGGSIQRLKSCQERIRDYLSGTLSVIEELEEPMLPEDIGTLWWSRMYTANAVSQAF